MNILKSDGKGGNEDPLRLYLTISGLYLKATFSSMEKHTSSCSNYIGIYTRRCIRQPLRTRQMQFQMEYTRALRLTERARQKERKRAGTHSWPAAILYHPATEAFQRWVAWECSCVCLCVCNLVRKYNLTLKEESPDLFVQSYWLLHSRALLVKVMDGHGLRSLSLLPLHDQTLTETANITFPTGKKKRRGLANRKGDLSWKRLLIYFASLKSRTEDGVFTREREENAFDQFWKQKFGWF